MNNAPFITDGDAGWVKVDTRRPAHELEPGVAADAVNKRLEDGRAWPRHGVNLQPWGRPLVNLIPTGAAYTLMNGPLGLTFYGYNVPNAVAGQELFWTQGANDTGLLQFPPGTSPANGDLGLPVLPGSFTFGGGLLQLRSTAALPVTAIVNRMQTPRGFGRFNDPNGTDNLVLLTDDWRDGATEDGGRGRAWRIVAGQGPQAVPMNGHDVWDECRLVPCYNGLLLIRQGNERHYFSAAAVNAVTSQIQLNTAPAWASGDQVQVWGDPLLNSVLQGTNALVNLANLYFVKIIAGNKAELYLDSALTTKLDMSGGAVGRFYLERQALAPGFFGNGAPTLLMQPDGSGKTAFEVGFLSAPANVAATAFDGTAKILKAPSHRLIPGDKITYTHTTLAVETFYVAVLNNDQVMLYTTQANALAGGITNAQAPTPAWASGDYLTKFGASALPMPPAREGVYLPCGRSVLVNGQNNLAISDPLDPLHYSPYQALINANLGESDAVTSVIPLGTDVQARDITIVGKENVILAAIGLSGPAANWQLKEITREYGFLAPLATIIYGADVWGLSRKGIVSVSQGTAGATIGVALPVSFDLKKYIDLIDWPRAHQACAATWNNRVFFAVPLKGQTGTPRNNAVLVFNGLNQGWEGVWNGSALQVYHFARHKVYGEERLCFVNYHGQVCWLGEGWTDMVAGAAPLGITDSLTTRIYSKGSQDPKLWLRGRVLWDTNNPTLTVTAQAPGYNEKWPLLTNLTYDPTKYQAANTPDYDPANPASNFDAPNRADYSLTPGELIAPSGSLDIHQNTSEALRMRINDWGVQLVIANTQGSARLQGVLVEAVPARRTASKQT